MAMRITRDMPEAGGKEFGVGRLSEYSGAARESVLRAGTSKLIVFVGAEQVDIGGLAEMAGQTLGLQRLAPATTGSGGVRVSPYSFLQMLQEGGFVGIYEKDGHLYGIEAEELEDRLNAGISLYLVAGRAMADKLKERYGERVCRVFVSLERQRLIERCRAAGIGDSALVEAQLKDDQAVAYREECELSYILQDDEAYTMFALAQALEPMLERGLVEYD